MVGTYKIYGTLEAHVVYIIPVDGYYNNSAARA